MRFLYSCTGVARILLCLTAYGVSGSLMANAQQGTSRAVPRVATLTPGATREFQALARDSIPLGAMWSATGGTVDASGVYVAGDEPGTYRVIATSPGGLADTATVTIVASLSRVVAHEAQPSAEALATLRSTLGTELEAISLHALGAPDSVKLTPGKVNVLAGRSVQFTLMGFWNGVAYPYSEADFKARGGSITRQGFFSAGTQLGKFVVIATAFQLGIHDTAWVYIAPSWLSLPTILAALTPVIMKWAWGWVTSGL